MRGMRLMRARGSVVSVSARGPVLNGFPPPPGAAWGREERSRGYLLYAGVLRMLSTAFPEPHISPVRRGGDVPNCT